MKSPKLYWLFILAVLAVMQVSCGGRGNTDAAGTILFLGDSITEAGYFITEIEDALTAEHQKYSFRIVNRGRGSETISGLTEASFPIDRPYLFTRLHKELRRFRPNWVVACYGMNCANYQPFDEARFVAYQKGVEKLIEQVHAAGARLILLTPPPYAKAVSELPENPEARQQFLDDKNSKALDVLEQNPLLYGYRKEYPYYDYVLEQYAEWLKTLTGRENVWVVDIRGAVVKRLEDSYDGDPIHPNLIGHHVMAEAYLSEWPRIVSEAHTMGKGQ